ncbi:MAG: ABC transporter permease [Ginsengibacter sp.]
MQKAQLKWQWEITSRTSYRIEDIKALWSYRHFLFSLVRREFLLNYQQTVLGPFWLIFPPLVTLVTYILVFNKMVGISTGTIPPVLFYFSGIVLWNFFSDCWSGTSTTFKENAHLFSKVYFPRIIIPVSLVCTHFLRFLLQFIFLLCIAGFYIFFRDLKVAFNFWLLVLPLAIICVGLIGLGMGLLFSVLTAKYRDISNLVTLGVRLLMFVTPVIYPLTSIPQRWRILVEINPLTSFFEIFRKGLLGEGTVNLGMFLYSFLFTIFISFGGLMIFNKQGDKLIDVV